MKNRACGAKNTPLAALAAGTNPARCARDPPPDTHPRRFQGAVPDPGVEYVLSSDALIKTETPDRTHETPYARRLTRSRRY